MCCQKSCFFFESGGTLGLLWEYQWLFWSEEINERHRHRYEFNNNYREQFEKAGLILSGQSPDGKLVEIVEAPNHPFYLASQFHPEFKSKPNQPHPLFEGFIAAALACDRNRNV